MGLHRVGWTLGLLVLLACGEEEGGPADAGSDAADSSEVEPSTIPEPEPAARPRMTPCGPGWREVQDPGVPDLVSCEPWPEAGHRDDCAVDEAHFPGTAGCQRLGTACPVGDWSEDIPDGATVVYVLEGAPAGGDGSIDQPFATIEEGVAAAADGDIVALSRGAFEEAVTIDRPITLWGACVAESVIGSVPGFEATLMLSGGAAVRNLQVTGAGLGMLVTRSATPVEVTSVLLRGTDGVQVRGAADLLASDIAIRNGAGDAFGAIGMFAYAGAHVTISRAVFERCTREGLAVRDWGTEVSLSDVAVRETLANQDNEGGYAVSTHAGGRLELERVVLELSANGGALVYEPETVLVATDTVFRTTTSRYSDRLASGLEVHSGARAELTRAVFEGNQDGASVRGEGTVLVASDVVIRDSLADVPGAALGLVVTEGGHADLERAALVRNMSTAAIVLDTGDLSASDILIRDSLADRDGRYGHGIEIFGGSVALHRAELDGNREVGILVGHALSDLSAEDLQIRGTISAGRSLGAAILVGNGAVAEVLRGVMADNQIFGVLANGGAVTMFDVVVERTAGRDCAGGCAGSDLLGVGMGAVGDGRLEATRFRVSEGALCGVQLADGGEMDLHDGIVSDNPIGANVQTQGFALSRIQDRVLYVGNQRSLDSVEMTLPEASEFVPDL